MNISQYISEIQKIYSSGDAREHAYRPAFQKLIEELVPDIQVINEPAYTGGNAPDFLFKKGDTPIAYAECKDINVDITDKKVQQQAKRYVDAFGKILLTNYFDIEILNEEGSVEVISIGEFDGNVIVPKEENFDRFVNLLRDYITPTYRSIRSAKKLAGIMASKAKILRDNALASLDANASSDIFQQYRAFQEVLISDLSKEEFADMYAQTLVYGLFVARYHDPTLPTFSRYEAQDLLPSTNPLLKKFFGHVAGTDYDPKIAWIVDSLIETYLATDVAGLMHKEFEKKSKDPVLHFYETFLSEYDKGLRKSRGVYYTPEPVVSFIIRSVDQILKQKFDLPKGLADTSTIPHTHKVQGVDARTKDGIKQITEDIHKVQILDPAVGTGTFLNEVIHEIHKNFSGQEGLWPSYVREHLLPRLHGFELMMASYTMAHLKLSVTLGELGYIGNERLSVWLTNSLEQGVHEVPNLFMSEWLTAESNEASRIKSDLPIMVVLGNPPYSVSSVNKGEHIQNLIKEYKKDLNERKINLDDDYIKFIRFAEDQVEKSGYGIVAMITNNSFLDGITHRQMRKHLMETFDEIYVLDLHGNSKKKETAPDGGKDENVFSIQQGVSINLFVKTGEDKKFADVYHAEMFGKQKEKYAKLRENSFGSIDWEKLKTPEPYYFFVPKNFEAEGDYKKGFGLEELLQKCSSGVETGKDSTVIKFDKSEIERVVEDFRYKNREDLSAIYRLKIDKVNQVVDDLKRQNFTIVPINYRPFDIRNTIYTNMSQGVLWRPRHAIMKHIVEKNNFILQVTSKNRQLSLGYIFIAKNISDRHLLDSAADSMSVFPLYLYAEDGVKVPNLDNEIWERINDIVGKTEPEDILDYIYAVLHSPSYREKYQEFLKIDFPRVPYPQDKETFWKLVELGRELRGLHLLESPKVNDFITTYPQAGNNVVVRKMTKNSIGFELTDKEKKLGKVWINDDQYFDNVPESAWNFYIGGYQPAQKWLKDRIARELSVEDIQHYQKMIVSLSETERIMGEVDGILMF